MYFNKIRHPANFVFAAQADPIAGSLSLASRSVPIAIKSIGGDGFRLSFETSGGQPHGSQAELTAELAGPSAHVLKLTADAGLLLSRKASGRPLLSGTRQATFGFSGAAWMLQFEYQAGMQFYGLGEHSQGFEKSGQRVKFWNTDVFGDYADCQAREGFTNPMYVAMPWMIVRQGDDFTGILVNHPGAVFMDLASNFVWNARNTEDLDRRSFYLGAPSGNAEVYIIAGPSLRELTRKLQHLVGHTPLPPLWALGHHQCRWGYSGPRDLEKLDQGFREHDIPCDGLWLDIDYMERYKVFTFSQTHWRDEHHVRKVIARLARRGRRVVPILDPGVKVEAGYAVCEDGLRRGIFCLNAEGRPYVGFVWPGKTYFPDYSLPEGRDWWSEHVRRFAESGVAGAWIDMNDPAVGSVEPDDMLFDRGSQPHESYHNQYALGMAKATRAGFLAARPEERPFVLSRSAFISSSRYTAVWTGDNASNWHHLRMSIPLSLGLALSGMPFNGPDVCGFMGDTTSNLAVAWYKAGFLFPFLRNHSTAGTRQQEPWELGSKACRIIGHYIRLRYKLLPYLYQLFIAQEETGEAILRPLCHDFEDTTALSLGKIEDQFLVGPNVLQAPVVHEGKKGRTVALPGTGAWFSTRDARWFSGGRRVRVICSANETPLFVREGAIIPMQAGERLSQQNDLAVVELHCFFRRETAGTHVLRYRCDDGATFAYQQGIRSAFTVAVTVEPDGKLTATFSEVALKYRPVRVRLVVYQSAQSVTICNGERRDPLALTARRWRFTGRPLTVYETPWITLKESPTNDHHPTIESRKESGSVISASLISA